MKKLIKKHQEGNELRVPTNIAYNADPQAAYLQKWLYARKKQLGENALLGQKFGNLDYTNTVSAPDSIKSLVGESDANMLKNNIDTSVQMDTTSFKNKYRMVDLKGRSGTSFFNKFTVLPEYDNTSVEVHERTHAMNPFPQENKVKHMIESNQFPIINKLKESGDADVQEVIKYQYSPSEIVPSLMQLRYDFNIDPSKVISPEDVLKFRNSDKNNTRLFWMFGDDDISKLLNEVAMNKQSKNNRLPIGRDGLVLKK